jgi:hypothetical protein
MTICEKHKKEHTEKEYPWGLNKKYFSCDECDLEREIFEQKEEEKYGRESDD